MFSRYIEYEYIDCFSIRAGGKARIVKVQDLEFQWATQKGDLPSNQEVYLRKKQFMTQLEADWGSTVKISSENTRPPIHILYLGNSYSHDWYDILGLLFTIDPATPAWRTVALARSLVTA
jgi:hypothetical protein